MVENLCPKYRSLFETLYKKKESGDIQNVYTRNGIINVKFTDEKTEKPTKIFHEEDIEYYFNDFISERVW